jgi:hypothetical protein
VRETWDSLIRDFVRHLKGANRAANTQTIYRRAAQGLVTFLEQEGPLPGPRQLTKRHVEAYMAHLIDTRSASMANVVYRALQQLMRWLLDEEEIDRSPMERMRPPIVPEKPVPVLTEAQLRALLATAKSASFVDRRDTAIIRLLLDTAAGSPRAPGWPSRTWTSTRTWRTWWARAGGRGRCRSASRPGWRWAATCGSAPRSVRPTGRSCGWRRRTAGCCRPAASGRCCAAAGTSPASRG